MEKGIFNLSQKYIKFHSKFTLPHFLDWEIPNWTFGPLLSVPYTLSHNAPFLIAKLLWGASLPQQLNSYLLDPETVLQRKIAYSSGILNSLDDQYTICTKRKRITRIPWATSPLLQFRLSRQGYAGDSKTMCNSTPTYLFFLSFSEIKTIAS